MKTLSRYLAREIGAATALVFAALILLFALFDLVEEIKDLGRGAYRLQIILLYVLLSVPDHVYGLFPIAALIGTLFALANLVANSEYTVMRASGVSLTGMTLAIARTGLVFALLTFVVGEFIAPPGAQLAHRIRSQAITGLIAQEFRSGLWIKDGSSFINVTEVLPDLTLRGIRIYEFDEGHRLRSISYAERARHKGDRRWLLAQVVQTTFEASRTNVRTIAEVDWQSVLDPGLLNVLQVKPEKMSAWRLYSYTQHLKENRQKALRYEISLWTKMMYPFAVLAMMMLALPFAYFQGRQGGVGAKIFAGIMLGLAFHFLNRLFSHLGLLNDWPAAYSAVLPTAIVLSLALGMMWWLERR